MTKFNPENKETLTNAESLGTAMGITDEADAKQYMSDYVEYLQRKMSVGYSEAKIVAESNLKYYSGYYSPEVERRVRNLFS